MIKIAIDGMGGDHAPAGVIKGTKMFLEKDTSNTEIICVCPEEKFKNAAGEYFSPRLKLVSCERYVPMDLKLSMTLFHDKDTTMYKIIHMLKNNEVNIAYSAGNTAAFVSLAVGTLKMIENVDRPAICVHLPNLKDGVTLFLDVGANISPKPYNLYQYALMGYLYAKNVLKIENPAVGILNIGEEPTKGDELRQKLFTLLSQEQHLNFVGNIEGHELFTGKADVIVTDGFSGNIVLKVSEGLGRSFKSIMLREINHSISGKIGFFIARNALVNYARKTDYAEYGGGVLLGVNGIVIVSHGRSSPRAIYNALALSKKIAESSFFEQLKEFSKKWVQQ